MITLFVSYLLFKITIRVPLHVVGKDLISERKMHEVRFVL